MAERRLGWGGEGVDYGGTRVVGFSTSSPGSLLFLFEVRASIIMVLLGRGLFAWPITDSDRDRVRRLGTASGGPYVLTFDE